MRRFLYFLMALLGFVVATSCGVEYGCPPVEYEQSQSQDADDERIETNAEDSVDDEKC